MEVKNLFIGPKFCHIGRIKQLIWNLQQRKCRLLLRRNVLRRDGQCTQDLSFDICSPFPQKQEGSMRQIGIYVSVELLCKISLPSSPSKTISSIQSLSVIHPRMLLEFSFQNENGIRLFVQCGFLHHMKHAGTPLPSFPLPQPWCHKIQR